MINDNKALLATAALYLIIFTVTFDMLGHCLMPVSVLFTSYLAWLYGRTAGLAGIVFSTAAHAAMLFVSGKPSLAELFTRYPILYFGVLTQAALVFLADHVKFLYDEIEETKNRLEAATRRAEEADRIKSSFMADLSHEIRNPLCSIIGYAGLLKDDDSLDESQRYLIDPIYSNSSHLLTLINKVLDFSKIESEAVTVENSEFDPVELVRDVCSSNGFLASSKGLKLESRFSGKFDRKLISDPLRLKQVLINLISNAVKFTETGAVTVSCAELSARGETAKVRFSVTDTGPGLSADEIARLFKPFKQASALTERTYGGTGLGLVIADRLVRLLGGTRIEVESEKGRGASFAFELNLRRGQETAEPASTAKSAIPTPAATKRELKILVTEDNLFNLTLIKTILESRSYRTIEASDGRTALKLALAQDPDIIFLDLHIPGLSGIEVARKIREAGRAMPIISISGDSSAETLRGCLEAGMNGCVVKPFGPEDIYSAIDRHLTPEARP